MGAAAEFTLTAGQVFAALFGIAAVAALWWAYFDVVAIVAERGPALYLLGQIAFRERDLGSFSPHRALAAIALLALIPLALGADALVALGWSPWRRWRPCWRS